MTPTAPCRSAENLLFLTNVVNIAQVIVLIYAMQILHWPLNLKSMQMNPGKPLESKQITARTDQCVVLGLDISLKYR